MVAAANLPATGALPTFYPAQKDTVQVVASRATRLCGWFIFNPNAGVAYVVFFDTTDTVVLATTVPKFALPLPGGAAANMFSHKGIYLANGLQIACVTTALGSSPPGTGLDVTLFYQ